MTRTGILTLVLFAVVATGCSRQPESILVFTKTAGYRHESIEPAIEAIKAMAVEKGFVVAATEDASQFNDAFLGRFDAIMFISTTGDVLDPTQQLALQRYIQAGGGYVGIHAASDTEYEWPWYGQLVGAYFTTHPGNPGIREATLHVVDGSHPATAHLPSEWVRADEWYEFKDEVPTRHVLLTIDEHTYKRPEENIAPDLRPIAWTNDFDGGRMFYTALGHTDESWTEPAFLDHVWGGIQYAIGTGSKLDYTRATVAPEENRFKKTVLDQNLDEPMELDFVDDDHIVFVERPGSVKIHTLSTGETSLIANISVSTFGEEGLLGVAVDPNHSENHWIYLAYSDAIKKQTNLSRFTLAGMELDRKSEVRMLTIAVDRDEACCHMGGSIEFDGEGNLFLSAGDNTNPFASDGFNPIDERRGRLHFDAQRSAGNSMDLRGKILRIKPQPDGSYTIPAGNLFADSERGRPEIYVMGNRNPFRISIDRHSGFLYWGEVGPDSNADSDQRGPRGYDEVNQARSSGFFGWPYLIANNLSYNDYDFAKSSNGSPFQPASIVNDSPNSTGIRQLPEAQPAFIWYPYNKSSAFPNLDAGGRTAMAGPVFHADDFPKTNVSFPHYFDGKLLIYDWMRDWMAAVTLTDDGDLVRVDRFLESTLELSNPMDMLFGPDGSLYVLEYGKTWNSRNLDARLSRITYNAGNRTPTAKMTTNATIGRTPLTVDFSASESLDPDSEGLSYAWDFDGDGTIDSRVASPQHAFNTPGIFRSSVTVTDDSGSSDVSSVEIWAGNEPPNVGIDVKGNRSFYFDNAKPAYSVNVSDAEDGSLADGGILPSAVTVSLAFVPQGRDLIAPSVGHQGLTKATAESIGAGLVETSDCLACHQTKDVSNGPPFEQIALHYARSPDAREYLIDKVQTGGGGIWGDRPMAAHPNLSRIDAGKMVDYIRSLAKSADESIMPLGVSGSLRFSQHDRTSPDGRYVITASYKDTGVDQITSLTAQDQLVLRSPILEAERLDASPGISSANGFIYGNGFVSPGSVDLTGLTGVSVVLGNGERQGRISVRIDAIDGREIAAIDLSAARNSTNEVRSILESINGEHALYFVLSGFADGFAGIDRFYITTG